MPIPPAHHPLWLLLQLSDGSFPSGGFAHSNGLEAAMVFGGAAEHVIDDFLDASVQQLGRAVLPFVRAAHECAIQKPRPKQDVEQDLEQDPEVETTLLESIDDAFDATLAMAVPNRASRAQGRALVSATSRVWTKQLEAIARHTLSNPAHHATMFGAIFGALGIGREETLVAYLHGSARTVLSAGVRLGLLGPLEAQGLLAERSALLDAIVEESIAIDPNDSAQTAPLVEVYAALHDRLDGRMFQS